VGVEPPLDLVLKVEEPVPRRGGRRGAHDADRDERGPARSPVDDTEPAAGETGVDPEYAHDASVWSEQVYGPESR
jgi:hypothetical protein